MSLYAMSDLHLSFTVDKSMSIYGSEWKNHVEKIEKNWRKRISEKDTVRLRISFGAAAAHGCSQFIMFPHYPPTSIGEMESVFIQAAEEYGASQMVYSHCHGSARYQDGFLGEVNGIRYRLVSSGYLKFEPEMILE